MRMTNWEQLARLLVDGPDLDQTSVAQGIAANLQALCGEGVLRTRQQPNPCVITMNPGSLGGSVSGGFAVDPSGQLINLNPSGSNSPDFTILTSDPTNPRWDLLVLDYLQNGDTLIPQPSNPANSVFMFLDDGFVLSVIKGTAAASPSYPSKGAADVILAGLKVPANATVGTSVAVDLTVREKASNLPLGLSTLVSANYQMLISDEYVRCNSFSSGFTVTLPPLAGCIGQTFTIKNLPPSSNSVNLEPSGSDFLEGANSALVMTGGNTVVVKGVITGWEVQ
jgi:hypothetical protein